VYFWSFNHRTRLGRKKISQVGVKIKMDGYKGRQIFLCGKGDWLHCLSELRAYEFMKYPPKTRGGY
jgi:hypothetical protein